MAENKHELIELSPGVFVYRLLARESVVYLCRTCLDSGTEAVLKRNETMMAINHVCPNCESVFLERNKPLTSLAMSPWG